MYDRTIPCARAIRILSCSNVSERGVSPRLSWSLPEVPATLGESVAGFGRILSYTPYHSNGPSLLPLDVPDHSLPPASLRTTYTAFIST